MPILSTLRILILNGLLLNDFFIAPTAANHEGRRDLKTAQQSIREAQVLSNNSSQQRQTRGKISSDLVMVDDQILFALGGDAATQSNQPAVAPSSTLFTISDTSSPFQPSTVSLPSLKPSSQPTVMPSSSSPIKSPTRKPMVSSSPTEKPKTRQPTLIPTNDPTKEPISSTPSRSPTEKPKTKQPTLNPTNDPTKEPNSSTPSRTPTEKPKTRQPTLNPTNDPTEKPRSSKPSSSPSEKPKTKQPSLNPTKAPASNVSVTDTVVYPTQTPSVSLMPMLNSNSSPVAMLTQNPTISRQPTIKPSIKVMVIATPSSPTVAPTYNSTLTTILNPTQGFGVTPTIKESNENPIHASHAAQATGSPSLQHSISIQPTTRPSINKLFSNFDRGDTKVSVPTSNHFSQNSSVAAATDGSHTTASTPTNQNDNLFLPSPLIAFLSALLALTAIGGAGLIIKEIIGSRQGKATSAARESPPFPITGESEIVQRNRKDRSALDRAIRDCLPAGLSARGSPPLPEQSDTVRQNRTERTTIARVIRDCLPINYSSDESGSEIRTRDNQRSALSRMILSYSVASDDQSGYSTTSSSRQDPRIFLLLDKMCLPSVQKEKKEDQESSVEPSPAIVACH